MDKVITVELSGSQAVQFREAAAYAEALEAQGAQLVLTGASLEIRGAKGKAGQIRSLVLRTATRIARGEV